MRQLDDENKLYVHDILNSSLFCKCYDRWYENDYLFQIDWSWDSLTSEQMEEWAGLLNIGEPTVQYIITHRVYSVSVVRYGLLQFKIITLDSDCNSIAGSDIILFCWFTNI